MDPSQCGAHLSLRGTSTGSLTLQGGPSFFFLLSTSSFRLRPSPSRQEQNDGYRSGRPFDRDEISDLNAHSSGTLLTLGIM